MTGCWATAARSSRKMSESKRQTRRDDPMDVDVDGQNQMSNVKCWNCGKSGHCASDCRENWSEDKGSGKSEGRNGKKGKGKGKGKGKLNSVENSNWQEGWSEGGTKQGEEQAEGWWNEAHADGWWKDEQTGSRHPGNQKDQQVQVKSTVLSRGASNTIDGDKSG